MLNTNNTATFETTLAAKAAQLLDQKKPGWAGSVDIDFLDLWSSDECLLAQVFGDFRTGLQRLGLYKSRGLQPEDFGFDVTKGDIAVLRSALVAEVIQRRAIG